MNSNDFTVKDLIEAGKEKRFFVSAPIPKYILEDTEPFRQFVEDEMRRRIEEWFDFGVLNNKDEDENQP